MEADVRGLILKVEGLTTEKRASTIVIKKLRDQKRSLTQQFRLDLEKVQDSVQTFVVNTTKQLKESLEARIVSTGRQLQDRVM